MKREIIEQNNWISFSDLMTGLMVIFLFIAINYIVQVIEYKFIEQDIYNKLQLEFKNEISTGDIELEPDGTVRFNPKDGNILFDQSVDTLSESFKKTLDIFIPRYISLIVDTSYIDYIKEIRIEGHTDTVPPKNYARDEDSYEYNLRLSSLRAFNVLKYIRKNNSFLSLPV